MKVLFFLLVFCSLFSDFQDVEKSVVDELIAPLKMKELNSSFQFHEEVLVPVEEKEVVETDPEEKTLHLLDTGEYEASYEYVLPSEEKCYEEEEMCVDYEFDLDPYCDPTKRWYFAIKPGYFYFSDNNMRHFFNDGGFILRAQSGCRFWEYLMVWMDGSYFEKTGESIGGGAKLKIKLATLTLGLKGIYYFNEYAAIYGGAGPRIFMMLLNNATPFVRGDDNEVGVGGGFDLGFWLFPIPQWKNFFIDVFGDYSWKKLRVDADEISSFDYDVNVSGISVGAGIGIRF